MCIVQTQKKPQPQPVTAALVRSPRWHRKKHGPGGRFGGPGSGLGGPDGGPGGPGGGSGGPGGGPGGPSGPGRF